ncbi:TPA: MerR family transcriptional regulator [Streptococcus suis]|uniref:MerR family transcriptional regulator n=1 Tax=Streptococcus suis TaxID=1307 RepID=UPI000CF5D93C|nr:MerR family transcriptional regulator [Streptococcus suis]MBS8101389.1 MerR family transcriptional regulator [Streptococcus suis]MCK3871096.1 MerR family transcriptional regulator [Streptococcus suis]NQK25420.1 MerR family transcriptional regulator [Streptococcus suis]NQL18615.1 MerR family transcriptional regulator [Streptococcus suis]HEM4148170.1 MerR family transcriptional regulator [Streptococcus suis]
MAENGYRYYNQENLARLQEILLFRELDFPLKDIQQLLDMTEVNRQQVLRDHITLLELKRERLDRIINHARLLTEKGGEVMDFHAFDSSQLEAYKVEAKERWGNISAFAEFEERYDASKDRVFAQEMQAIFEIFGKMQSLGAVHPDVQAQVANLQAYITENFYTCTKEILQNLGLMYVEDERFSANIDQAGGPGTAAFVSQAIAIYCKE